MTNAQLDASIAVNAARHAELHATLASQAAKPAQLRGALDALTATKAQMDIEAQALRELEAQTKTEFDRARLDRPKLLSKLRRGDEPTEEKKDYEEAIAREQTARSQLERTQARASTLDLEVQRLEGHVAEYQAAKDKLRALYARVFDDKDAGDEEARARSSVRMLEADLARLAEDTKRWRRAARLMRIAQSVVSDLGMLVGHVKRSGYVKLLSDQWSINTKFFEFREISGVALLEERLAQAGAMCLQAQILRPELLEEALDAQFDSNSFLHSPLFTQTFNSFGALPTKLRETLFEGLERAGVAAAGVEWLAGLCHSRTDSAIAMEKQTKEDLDTARETLDEIRREVFERQSVLPLYVKG